MSYFRWSLIVVSVASLLMAGGCAKEAEEKVEQAGQDLAEAWEAEKAAAVRELNLAVEKTSDDIAAIRERAARLETQGAAAAAEAWHSMANRMEAARDATVGEINALENAGAETWADARDAAADAVAKLDASWEAEKAAIAQDAREFVDATSENVAAMRERAAELEAAGANAAAAAWHRAAEKMEQAGEAASREIEALENATADEWHAAADAASDAVAEGEEMGAHLESFAVEVKNKFVEVAQSIIDTSVQNLQLAAADEWQEIVAALEEGQRQAAAELKKVEEAGEGAWAELRHGFVAAYHDLRDANRKALEHLKEI